MKRFAFLFPGQGAQSPGMGKDLYDQFAVCKETFQEADDVLQRHLSKIIFDGPEDVLTETKNSQVGIFVMSMAVLRLVQSQFSGILPSVCAGLSLGEYTALVASGRILFKEALPLVQRRGELMNEACLATKGTMAVVMGLDEPTINEVVKEVALPQDLWVANFNCPGQIVLSGTALGIEKGEKKAKEKGAKRVLPLQVHGAFHSGLMSMAGDRLKEYIDQANIIDSSVDLVMNVSGAYEKDVENIRKLLVAQVTSSVRWEQGIRAMDAKGVDVYIEMGPGKTLSGMNKRIGVSAPTINIETVADLAQLETL